jgi:hypothetical protein
MLNPDLKTFNIDDAYYHFVKYCKSKKETRLFEFNNTLIDFDPKKYKLLNVDLQHLSDEDLFIHYEHTGFYEKRKIKWNNIPIDFDPEEYKLINKDLYNLSDDDVKIHYENIGFNEGLQYKIINTYKSTDAKIQILLHNYSVLCYSTPKTASMTLYTSFLNCNIQSIHCHDNDTLISYLGCEYEPNFINKFIFMQSQKPIYIFDTFRDPLERLISEFFETNGNFILNTIKNIHNPCDDEIEYLINYFNKQYISVESIIRNAFDDYKSFNIDIFDYNFDKKNKLLNIKKNNITIIILLFDDIDNWENKIKEQCNMSNFKLIKSNITDNKEITTIYKLFKNKYKMSKIMYNLFIYITAKKLNYFYDDDNVIKIQNKWKKYIYDDYKIVLLLPCDFLVENYKKLNEDLQNMTDDEAITHYMTTGKNENRLYKLRFISLVTMFKNEDNIVYFVEYYKNLGIDHIFLFDNNSDKNYKNDLQQYIDINFVTYLNYNFIPPNGNIDEFWDDNNFPLHQVFNETIDTKSEYIMFFDADEYLHLELTFENFKEKIKSLNCDLISIPLVNIPFDITNSSDTNNNYFFGKVNQYDKMIINVKAHKNKRYRNAHAVVNKLKYPEITFCNINNTNKIDTYLNHYWMNSTKYFIDRFTKIIPQSFTNNEIINLLINNIKPNKYGQYVGRLYERLVYAQSTLLDINLYNKLLVNNNEKINELLNSYILDINIRV